MAFFTHWITSLYLLLVILPTTGTGTGITGLHLIRKCSYWLWNCLFLCFSVIFQFYYLIRLFLRLFFFTNTARRFDVSPVCTFLEHVVFNFACLIANYFYSRIYSFLHNSSQIRRLGALDSTWVTSSSNGLQGHAHPAWLHLYLSTCKLLHLALVLPATRLPQFQMYRWAFVGDESLLCEDGDISTSSRPIQQVTPNFVPYLSRIYKLLRNKVWVKFLFLFYQIESNLLFFV